VRVCRQKDRTRSAPGPRRGGDPTSDGGEYGKGKEELAAEVNGGDIKIAINPRYIIDTLKVMAGEQITLNWTSEISPVMITSPRDPAFTYIVMPIRMD
jgi:DNA polymerase-3 subunit beta